jgi:hypothetical protein
MICYKRGGEKRKADRRLDFLPRPTAASPFAEVLSRGEGGYYPDILRSLVPIFRIFRGLT